MLSLVKSQESSLNSLKTNLLELVYLPDGPKFDELSYENLEDIVEQN